MNTLEYAQCNNNQIILSRILCILQKLYQSMHTTTINVKSVHRPQVYLRTSQYELVPICYNQLLVLANKYSCSSNTNLVVVARELLLQLRLVVCILLYQLVVARSTNTTSLEQLLYLLCMYAYIVCIIYESYTYTMHNLGACRLCNLQQEFLLQQIQSVYYHNVFFIILHVWIRIERHLSSDVLASEIALLACSSDESSADETSLSFSKVLMESKSLMPAV